MPLASKRKRSPEELLKRLEDWPEKTVPFGVRFLTAAVDVQAHRFAVTIMGWGVGLESWLIDRFSISASERAEGTRKAALDPAAFVEDWHVLVDDVINRTYTYANGETIKPRVTLCDSGGKQGVTDKAYEFYRAIRKKGLGRRFMLVKGVGNINAPRVAESWPDARARKDRTAGRGDVPVWLLNVNSLKDGISGDIGRDEPGPGYVHLPSWLDESYFDEMTAETRTEKGWIKEAGRANEAIDLHCYNRAACIILRAEAIRWDDPPSWAAERGATAKAAETTPKKRAALPRRNWVNNW
jgi:phage terminase large subunit GpA-like protein